MTASTVWRLLAAASALSITTGCTGDDTNPPGRDAGGGDAALDAGVDGTTGSADAQPEAAAEAGIDASYGSVGPIVQVQLPAARIPKFVDPVPTFTGRRVSGASAPLTVTMRELQQKVLPASIYEGLPAPYSAGTYVWGYDVNGTGASWPATTIEAQRGAPTKVRYVNDLQGPGGAAPYLQRYLVVDPTLHWADPLGVTMANGCMDGPPLAQACLAPAFGPVPAVVHLHGAEVSSASDGHPDAWFTPDSPIFGALRGPAYMGNVYTYPNGQEATTLWFHDHALGEVRLNVYSGLAGFYLLRDARDTGLATNPIGLPAGAFEQEFVVQDRQFDTNGQLYFPNGTYGNAAGLNGPPPNPDDHPFWIPEFFGDVMTVNGKSWPYLEVQPRRYRLRVLNGSNARFLQMTLVDTTGTDGGVPVALPDGGFSAGLPIYQIGSDGGFLDAPVKLDPSVQDDLYTGLLGQAVPRSLFLAPAERADAIVDFGGQMGKTFTLVNGAVAPFPSGGTALDPAGNGLVMQFRVTVPLAGTDATVDPASPPGGWPRATPIVDIKPTAATPPSQTRQLVLVEVENPAFIGTPEEALLNNTHWDGLPESSRAPMMDAGPGDGGTSSTENARVGTTEVWEIANLTMDAHPIHVHLVQFQMLERQALVLTDPTNPTTSKYRDAWNGAFLGGAFLPGDGPPSDYGTPNSDGALGGNVAFGAAGPAVAASYPSGYFAAAALPPEPEERGWKDTIKVLPGWVTRVAIRWAPQGAPATGAGAPQPGTNLFPFDPTLFGPDAGPGYVWHCHILDHEDNEMMRPYLVTR